jgi:hypothetical protein
MAGLPLRTASQNQLLNRTLAPKIFDDRFLKTLQYSPKFPLRKETRDDDKLAARVGCGFELDSPSKKCDPTFNYNHTKHC